MAELISLASPIVGGSLGPPASEALPVGIRIKRFWRDQWRVITQPVVANLETLTHEDLRVDWVQWNTAPTPSSAQLSFRYGTRLNTNEQPDPAVAAHHFYRRAFLTQLHRQFVHIAIANDPGTAAHFVGVMDIEGRSHFGSPTNDLGERVPSGDQVILAYGFEHLLKQIPVLTSFWHDDLYGFSGREIERGLTFNDKGLPNRTFQKEPFVGAQDPDDPPVHLFSVEYSVHLKLAKFWSTRDIVEYLLGFHRLKTGTGIEIPIRVDDIELAKLPDWDMPIVETHGRTVFDLLNQVLSRQRFFTWWIEYDADTDEMKLRIETFTEDDITLPNGKTIKANTAAIVLDVSDDASAILQVKEDHSSVVDQVIVHGARRRNCFTVTTPDLLIAPNPPGEQGTFVQHWTQLLEDDYNIGAAGSPHYTILTAAQREARRKVIAQYRTKERFLDVYSKFGLDPAGSYPQFGTSDPQDPTGQYKRYFSDIRILETIPLLQGIDYSLERIADDELDNEIFGVEPHQERKPMFLIKTVLSKPEEKLIFVPIDKIGRTGYEVASQWEIKDAPFKTELDWTCNVLISDEDPTWRLIIHGKPQHVIAKGSFNPLPEEVQNTWGDLRWQEMLITIAIEDDRFCDARYPPDEGLTNLNRDNRQFFIDAGRDFRLDWVAPGTIVDLDDKNFPLWTVSGGVIRDDRPELDVIAQLAYQFYSVPRRTIQLEADYRYMVPTIAEFLRSGIPLGLFVKAVLQTSSLPDQEDPAGFQEIGTIITRFQVDFPRGEGELPVSRIGRAEMHFETDFAQFDPLQFRSVNPSRARRDLGATRILHSRIQTQGVVDRPRFLGIRPR